MNIAIIDDSSADRQLLEDYIRHYCSAHHMQVHCSPYESGEAFLEQFESALFDVIFLDIYMNGVDGIHVAERIREVDESCLIIFVTTSDHHAVRSYRVRAFDYLVKPYDYPCLEETMDLVSAATHQKYRYIEVKEGRTQTRILLHDILYVDYYNHYVQIHTRQRMVRTYMPFSEFAPLLLGEPQFLCCYRNCIVNLDEVALMDETDFLMTDGIRIPILRRQRAEVRQRYADYTFEKLKSKKP
ncbi:LytR/AlgR family response regulator transcription factor [Feifania hominis]|uniref:Stage 0 sporulation protein A homolog n=1 Tax=Feifania hominis TaxID=2763660 RepID=A0A926DDQ3_9FIRM|nr:LytTR family DNA-binding domain-containing protein [Feifania hominis]MBC8535914.1 response regulator transcription factor [Feifania hominis]